MNWLTKLGTGRSHALNRFRSGSPSCCERRLHGATLTGKRSQIASVTLQRLIGISHFLTVKVKSSDLFHFREGVSP